MRRVIKVALMCAAVVGSTLATSCEDPKEEKKFAINFEAAPTGGTVEVIVGGAKIASGDKFKAGAEVTIRATPGEGYSSVVWGGVDAENEAALETTFEMPNEDVTLTATFGETPTATLNFTANPKGGTVTVEVAGEAIESGANVEVGAEVTIKIELAAGYDGVTWGGVALDNPTALETTFNMPDEAVTLTTAFTTIPYTITFANVVNGSIEVRINGGEPIESGAQFPVDVEVYVKATADTDAGYIFDAWDIEGVTITDETSEITFDMPASDITIGANFKIDESNDWVSVGGTRWAKYNVGAPGEFVANPEDFGMLYQHRQVVGWDGITPNPSTGKFYTYIPTSPDAGWGSGAGADNNPYGQGPCPTGYTVATKAQYDALIAAATATVAPLNGVDGVKFTDESGASVFFPYAGYDGSGSRPTGDTYSRTMSSSFYWKNETVSWNGMMGPPAFATAINMAADSFTQQNMPRHNLLSVRCVRAE